MTGRAIRTPRAPAWLRRAAVVLAILTAVIAVRGPVCPDAMMTGMPPAPTMSTVVGGSAAVSAPETGSASMPPGLCPALTLATGGSTADLGSCVQPPPTAIGVTAASALTADRDTGYPPAPSATVPPVMRTAVLHHAATLHQLGLLRT